MKRKPHVKPFYSRPCICFRSDGFLHEYIETRTITRHSSSLLSAVIHVLNYFYVLLTNSVFTCVVMVSEPKLTVVNGDRHHYDLTGTTLILLVSCFHFHVDWLMKLIPHTHHPMICSLHSYSILCTNIALGSFPLFPFTFLVKWFFLFYL